jgi:hypothetical protein
MQYLLMIYANEAMEQSMPQEEMGKMFQEYFAMTERWKQSGKYKGGEALQPVATATTVRLRDGKVLTTDGPFAETAEQIGGYYLVDAANLDEAIQLAAEIPSARHGSIEIRPVMVFGN